MTLADLERRDLPTIRAAASTILDHAGNLGVRRGNLEIGLPERLAPETGEHDRLLPELLDASTVLLAAGSIVVGALESSSKKPLIERLPDVQVLAAGGVQ